MVVFSLVSGSAARSNSDRPTATATVTIGSVKEQLVDSTFAGFSYEKWALSQPLFSASNTALINLFKLLGPGILRVGGNRVNETTWSATGPGLTQRFTAPSDVDRLAGFLRATGWKVIYGLNGTTSTPALSASEAAYAVAALGDRLFGFEIGNEPNLYHGNGLKPKTYAFADFLADWESYWAAIDKTTPGAVMTGPGAFDDGLYAEQFAASEAAKISLLTQHYYRGDGRAAKSTVDLLLSQDQALERTLAALKGVVSDHHIVRGYRMDEANSFYNGGAPGVSDTLGSALWAFEFCFTLAQNGATGVNFHGGGSGPGYTPIADEDNGKVVEVRPEFYGLLLFAKMARGSLLMTHVKGTSTALSAYAVDETDGSWDVALANTSRTENVDVSISLPPSRSRVTAMTLTASNLDSTSDVTFGGAKVNSDGSWNPTKIYSVPTCAVPVLISVPTNTVILIQTQAKIKSSANAAQGAYSTERNVRFQCATRKNKR